MFGFEAINDGSSVLVSNNHRHLSFKERLSVTVTNTVVDRPSTGSASFSSPVTTQAPPTIFAKLQSTRHSSIEMYCVVLGSPGNWTGVRFYASAYGGSTLPLYVLDCVVCHFITADTSEDFGMVLYDEEGVPVFCHDNKLVKYSKFTKKWTLQKTSSAYSYYTFRPDVTIATDDYIDVSSLNRGVVMQLVYGMMFSSVRIYRDNSPTLELVAQANSNTSNPQGVSEMNFCIPVCKFPESVYHN